MIQDIRLEHQAFMIMSLSKVPKMAGKSGIIFFQDGTALLTPIGIIASKVISIIMGIRWQQLIMSLYHKRHLDMLSSGYFSGGDTVLIRFRLIFRSLYFWLGLGH